MHVLPHIRYIADISRTRQLCPAVVVVYLKLLFMMSLSLSCMLFSFHNLVVTLSMITNVPCCLGSKVNKDGVDMFILNFLSSWFDWFHQVITTN